MARAGTTLACVPPRDYNARPVLTVSSRWREVPASLWHSVLTPCPPGVLKRPGRQREFILFVGKLLMDVNEVACWVSHNFQWSEIIRTLICSLCIQTQIIIYSIPACEDQYM